MMLTILGNHNYNYILYRSIDFTKVKAIAKELGETMNDEELEEMMHHIHILKKTEVPNEINFDEFYEIITAPRRYWLIKISF